MRCHQKFADKAEAVQMFSYGELRVLAAQDVTDSEIEEMRKLKEATPDLNRADIAKLLKALRMRDEELADKDTHVANIEGLLADSKLALDQSSRENAHLKQKIAEHEKEIFEQEKNVATLSEMLARNSAGYPALEKALADKEKELDAVADQLKALQALPPKLERVEVPVETLPASYASLREALDSLSRQLDEKMQEKQALDERTAQIEKRLNESHAALDAHLAVKEALTDLTASWSLIAAKMATVQLAVQASANPAEFNSTLEAMAANMRKYLSEIEAALQRTQE
jgi:chromosome segregation ATPase